MSSIPLAVKRRIIDADVRIRELEEQLAAREAQSVRDAVSADEIRQALRKPFADFIRDAERYRWLREQQWNEADMFVIAGSKSQVRLGTHCPSLERLDSAVDAAMKSAPPQKPVSDEVKP